MQKTTSAYINLLIVILILISVFVIFYVYSNVQENKTAANWEKTFGRIEDLPNQYPYRNDNEAAIHLKTLAIGLGTNFALPGEGSNFLPQPLDAERLIRLRKNFPWWKYLEKQFEAKDGSVDPPYGLLAKYHADLSEEIGRRPRLSSYLTGLARFTRKILSSRALRWWGANGLPYIYEGARYKQLPFSGFYVRL